MIRTGMLLWALAPCAALPAQTTWFVGPLLDPANHFDQIQAAFDAAAPGDTIVVKSHGGQGYHPATTSKGVALLSTSFWTFTDSITVVDLPADQQFVMEGFQGPFGLTGRNCLGGIHAEGLVFLSAGGSCSAPARGLRFENCSLVSVNWSSLWDVVVEGGTALFTGCYIYGTTHCPDRFTGNPGLTITDADVTLAGGAVFGPWVWPITSVTGEPAILMQRGSLRFAGKDVLDGINGAFIQQFPYPYRYGPPIVSNGGTVVVDPDVNVVGTITGNSTVTYEDLPYMRVGKIFPAVVNTLPIEVVAPPHSSVFACISEPFPPMPTFLGDLWLDPRAGGIVLVASGTVPPDGLFSTRSPLNAPWPPGVAPLFQAVVVHQGMISLSEPVIGVGGVPY